MQKSHQHALNKLFNQAIAEKSKSIAPAFIPKRRADEDEEEAVDPTEPERILAAFKKKDFFKCLQLDGVKLDEYGRATWDVSDSDLSRAFRKVSLRVHPDKNPSPDAREAFERLKAAKNLLADPTKRAEIIKEQGEKELQRLHKEDPSAIKRIEKAKAAAQAAEYQASILAQAKQKQERLAQQRREAERKRDKESDSDSDSEEWKGPQAKRNVKRPKRGAF